MAKLSQYVAFMRGLNLGRRRLSMDQLRGYFEELGYDAVETYIASGNVIFQTAKKSDAKLASEIADHLQHSLGYEVDTFVRTAAEVRQIASAEIFPQQSEDGWSMHVSFLAKALAPKTVKALETIETDEDLFRVVGREIFWLRYGKMSDSEVWNLPEMKALKLPSSTMRNMNTVRKLSAKYLA
ncbi:DUF1697 domain-containing protein [Bremerella sp. JC817]|uniref:DUF1697 domain-containing protein n=1 Tax=Bremerella sp. JC817 TaxID=3231756 RepID=UPI00345B1695